MCLGHYASFWVLSYENTILNLDCLYSVCIHSQEQTFAKDALILYLHEETRFRAAVCASIYFLLNFGHQYMYLPLEHWTTLLYAKNLDGNKKVFPLDVCCASVRMIALETACRKIRTASFIQTKSSLQYRFLISYWLIVSFF